MLSSSISHSIKIGFTGHMDIRKEDAPIVREKIRVKIRELLISHPRKQLTIISGNAEGADQLLIQILKEPDFRSIQHTNINEKVKRSAAINDEEKKEKEEIESDDSYYKKQAYYIIDNSSIIMADWNGIFNHKPGGTSDIVNMALKKTLSFIIS